MKSKFKPKVSTSIFKFQTWIPKVKEEQRKSKYIYSLYELRTSFMFLLLIQYYYFRDQVDAIWLLANVKRQQKQQEGREVQQRQLLSVVDQSSYTHDGVVCTRLVLLTPDTSYSSSSTKVVFGQQEKYVHVIS